MKTQHIFITGNSRSGTTLLARMLKQHSRVYILNETHFYEEYIQKSQNVTTLEGKRALINRMLSIHEFGICRKNIVNDYPDDVNFILSKIKNDEENKYLLIAQVFKLIAQKNGKNISGDQTPRNIFYLDEILKKFSGSKALVMVRDSRDVILSQKNKWKASERKGQPRFEVLRSRFNYHPITASLIWNQGIKAALKFKNDRYAQDVRFIIFEKLLLHPQKVTRDIVEFLGIGFEDKMFDISVSMSSNIKEDTQRQKGIVPSVAGKWRENLNKTEAYLCQRITRHHLKYFGYDIEPIKPNYIVLIVYLLTFLPKLAVAVCLNLNRMGNPIQFIVKRISMTFTK